MNTSKEGVDFHHPLYVKHNHQVTVCNDIYDGIDTAKKYIVQQPLEDDDDYGNRVAVSVLNSFVERIITTQAGMIFRKDVTLEDIPESTKYLLEELDIGQFTKETTEATIRDGIGLILVDIGVDGGDPYLTHIRRQSLINWEKDEEGNFTMAVIKEAVLVREGFKVEYIDQYRHIKENGDVDIWQEVKGKGLELVDTIVTSYNFVPLYDAPLSLIPPLYDIATVNIAHMNMSSVLDASTATCMQPSLFTKGLGIEEGDNIKFSTNSTINTDNENAEVEWLELKGESIPYGVTNLERKERYMADRALQMQADVDTIKTATQVATENSENTARLTDIAELMEVCINNAYNAWHIMKYNTDAVGKIIMSRDFRASPDPTLIIGLNQGVIAGNISRYTYIKALIDAELIQVEDIEEEITRIDAEFIEPENENTQFGN